MSKTEKRIHQNEYTSPKWYEDQLAEDWYIHDWDGEYLVMRKMSENGYGETTAQQARLQSYGTIWELNKTQMKILLGKDYREELFSDWEQRRQEPLQKYREWLKRK